MPTPIKFAPDIEPSELRTARRYLMEGQSEPSPAKPRPREVAPVVLHIGIARVRQRAAARAANVAENARDR